MKTESEQMKELLDRVRRMETRLTAFLVAQGATTTTEKPEWQHNDQGYADSGAIHIPSLDCSLRTILAAVPKDCGYGIICVELAGKPVMKMMVAAEFQK